MSDSKNEPTELRLPKQDKARAALEEMKRGFAFFEEYQRELAKRRRAAFDAHVKQGFTADQALELVKTLPG